MTSDSVPAMDFASIKKRREHLQAIRTQVAERHRAGGNGIEICNWFSDQLDDLLRGMISSALVESGVSKEARFCVICVGGNGRRRPTPYSDVDLLLVANNKEKLEKAAIC